MSHDVKQYLRRADNDVRILDVQLLQPPRTIPEIHSRCFSAKRFAVELSPGSDRVMLLRCM